MMYNILKTKYEIRLCVLALTKGLKLIQIKRQPNSDAGSNLYRLTSATGKTVFPSDNQNTGTTLREAEDWLMGRNQYTP